MTKFNPEGKASLTNGECLHPAMKITDADDAAQYLRDYVTFIQGQLDKEPRQGGMTAEQIAKTSLWYFAGYYDGKTRAMVERLFMCKHPVFGAIKDGKPSPWQAFNEGIKAAAQMKEED